MQNNQLKHKMCPPSQQELTKIIAFSLMPNQFSQTKTSYAISIKQNMFQGKAVYLYRLLPTNTTDTAFSRHLQHPEEQLYFLLSDGW